MNPLPIQLVAAFCVISFLIYSITCLTTNHMKREFERYGLARFRILTGGLQLLGVIGLLVGLHRPVIGILAASGFAIQMLLALWVRHTINDRAIQRFPALLYLSLNAWLVVEFSRLAWAVAPAANGR